MQKNNFLFFIIAIFSFSISLAQGDVTVTSLADDNSPGTLRWAMDMANSDSGINEIIFDPSLSGTITLTSNLPNVTSNLVITGPGASEITISGDNQYRMFVINNGPILDISGLTFTNNANDYSNGTIFEVSGSTVNASGIVVTGINNNTAFWSKRDGSIINISNSTFTDNSASLFMSDWGSTPSITSDNESDYTNRITVTGSTFSSNSGVIFSTERYVKIDNCIFTENTNQIGSFRGVNRYQVLNSTFTDNTGYWLFYFSSWIGGTPSWGEGTLGANNTLFDGNVFTGNTGTVINPGGIPKYDNKTTISNNTFVNNGTNWTGNPIVVSGNVLNNFITSVTHSVDDSTVLVTMSRPVFGTATGSGILEANDFQFSLSGGNATLGSTSPTSISISGNTYTLGIEIVGDIHGMEELTISPADETSIYDATANRASIAQKNNTILLNFLDDDSDGVANYQDMCPETPLGDIVETNGCTDITPPTVPAGLATTARPYRINLNWDSNSDDTAGYNLYGGTDENSLTLITQFFYIGINTYGHSGLNIGTTYYYSLSAFDHAGNESNRSPVISNSPTLPFIWDGPKIIVEKLSNTDWTQAENQDFLTENVIITRGNNQGLFNIANEPTYNHYSSPTGTEWALGTTADFGALNFSSWVNTMGWDPRGSVGQDYVVHLISDDIYLDVKILSWAGGSSGGGFSYERSTPSPDEDGDRIKDELDTCPNTPEGEVVDINGCSDSQKDEDNDGVNNTLDICPNTPIGDTVDANGCSDTQKDSDNDGVNDALDNCDDTPTDETVDANGCSNSQKDSDNDGVNDALDTCPSTPAGEIVDANGCSDSQKDSDSDGVNDALDTCDNTPTGEIVDANGCSDSQKDSDSDGVNDALDTCDNTPTGEIVDANGCSDSQKDSDSDSVNDALDNCDNTPTGEIVDANGCSDSQKDADNDGINDNMDDCPNTPGGETADDQGCSDSQKDSDFDGVNDAADACPDSPQDEVVDGDGCTDSQKDDDNDGVNNDRDECPGTPAGETVDDQGCADSQKEDEGEIDADADNDGIADEMDNCPAIYNPNQEDRDDDGLGDVCDTVELDVSRAFSPNGDGINDTWAIYNIVNYPNSLVRVFNSWGKEVFSARNYQNDWDGRYKNLGAKLPDAGSYYYQIDLEGDGKVDQDGWLYISSN